MAILMFVLATVVPTVSAAAEDDAAPCWYHRWNHGPYWPCCDAMVATDHFTVCVTFQSYDPAAPGLLLA